MLRRIAVRVKDALMSKEARRAEIALLIIVGNSIADEFGVKIPFDQLLGLFFS